MTPSTCCSRRSVIPTYASSLLKPLLQTALAMDWMWSVAIVWCCESGCSCEREDAGGERPGWGMLSRTVPSGVFSTGRELSGDQISYYVYRHVPLYQPAISGCVALCDRRLLMLSRVCCGGGTALRVSPTPTSVE